MEIESRRYGRAVVNGQQEQDGKGGAENPQRGDDYAALVYLGPHAPVFSSLVKRSRLEDTVTELSGNVSSTRIIPAAPIPAPTLAEISKPSLDIVQKTTIQKNIAQHPIHTHLPTAQWLRYDAFTSFAPRKDEGSSVVPETLANQTWWERVGRDTFYLQKGSELVEEKREVDDMDIDPELINSWEPDPDPKDKDHLYALGKDIEELHAKQAARLAEPRTHPDTAEIELAESIKSRLADMVGSLPPSTFGVLTAPVLSVLGPSYQGTLPSEESYRPNNEALTATPNPRMSSSHMSESLRVEIARRGLSSRGMRR